MHLSYIPLFGLKGINMTRLKLILGIVIGMTLCGLLEYSSYLY